MKKKVILSILIVVLVAVSIFSIVQLQNNGTFKQTSGNKPVDKPNVEIIQKEQASYEEWLAAAMCVALSLNGEEFTIDHIYYLSETTLDNKLESKGAYVIYHNDNGTFCIESKPLKEERLDKGKINLYTQDLGFATFDKINQSNINFSSYHETDLDSLSTLISQSLLVSLYEN